MIQIDKTLDLIDVRCKEKTLRLTTKRKHILAILVASKKGLSAYEIIDAYKEHFGDTLKAMSVYRILSFLQTEQLVHKISTTNKFVACIDESCQPEHPLPLFLICRECQDYKETLIEPSLMAALQQNAFNAGFQVKGSQLELDGICHSCQS